MDPTAEGVMPMEAHGSGARCRRSHADGWNTCCASNGGRQAVRPAARAAAGRQALHPAAGRTTGRQAVHREAGSIAAVATRAARVELQPAVGWQAPHVQRAVPCSRPDPGGDPGNQQCWPGGSTCRAASCPLTDVSAIRASRISRDACAAATEPQFPYVKWSHGSVRRM